MWKFYVSVVISVYSEGSTPSKREQMVSLSINLLQMMSRGQAKVLSIGFKSPIDP